MSSAPASTATTFECSLYAAYPDDDTMPTVEELVAMPTPTLDDLVGGRRVVERSSRSESAHMDEDAGDDSLGDIFENKLLARLQTLCGSAPFPFHHHERVYVSASTRETLRLVRPLHMPPSHSCLIALGRPEPRFAGAASTSVRSVSYVPMRGGAGIGSGTGDSIGSRGVTGDPQHFLEALDYKCAFEFEKHGLAFAYGDHIRVTVSQLLTMGVNANRRTGDDETQASSTVTSTSSSSPLDPDHWLVEVHSTPVENDSVAAMAKQVQWFASRLSAVIALTSVDHRVLTMDL